MPIETSHVYTRDLESGKQIKAVVVYDDDPNGLVYFQFGTTDMETYMEINIPRVDLLPVLKLLNSAPSSLESHPFF